MFWENPNFVFDFVWIPKNFRVKLIFLSVLIDSQKLPCMPMGLPKLSIEPVNKRVLGPFLIVGLRVEQINRILALLSIDETKPSGSCCPVKSRIIDKIDIRQHCVPIPRVFSAIFWENIGNHTVMPFHLTISLRVIRRSSCFVHLK